MTNREFYNAAIKVFGADKANKALVDFAVEAIAKLDKKNFQRSSKPSKTAIANEPIKARILDVLRESKTPLTAATIGATIEQSTSKASALCVQLAKDGKVDVCAVKVKGKGKVNGYTIHADVDDDIIDENEDE